MADIIGQASNLNNKKILKKAFMEYTTSHELKGFMGTEDTAIIQMKSQEGKGAGSSMYFSLRDAKDPSTAIVKGTTTLEGSEVQDTLLDDLLTIDNRRMAMQVPNHELENIRTPIELYDVIRPQLVDAMSRGLRDDIISLADVTATPDRTRVLFGATDANYNATLATALANIDSASDTLSVEMIRIAKDKARNVARVSNGDSTRKIRPSFIQFENGAIVEKYVMWVGPKAARDLQNDADWKDLRAADRDNELALKYFSGSDYLGEVDGVMVFRIDRMDELLVKAGAGATAIDVYQAVLVGAQAFGYGVGMTGKFAMSDNTDYDFNFKTGYHVIDGIKLLTFNSIEQGLVHVFHA